MQFVVLGHFNEKFNALTPQQQQEGSHGEWAKSREYYSKGQLRQIWVYEKDQGIISIFEADSREHMEALLSDYPGVKAGWVTAEKLYRIHSELDRQFIDRALEREQYGTSGGAVGVDTRASARE